MLENKKIVISLRMLRWMASLIVFFPFTFTNLNIKQELTTTVEMLKIMSFALFLYAHRLRKSDISPLIIIFAIYQMSYLIPSIVYGSISLRIFYLWIKSTFSIIAFLLMLQCYMLTNYKQAINALYYAIGLVLIIHSMFASFSNILLAGIRTRFTDFFIPALALLFVIIKSKTRKLNKFDIIFVVASAYFVISQAVSTSIVVLLVFTLALLVENSPSINRFIEKTCQYVVMVCMALFLNVGILVFRIQNIFSFLIEGILHESLTLNGRTTIWDQTFIQLSNHNVLLGAGMQPEGSKDIHFSLYNRWGDNLLTDRQAHNQLLSVFYFNGVVGLICYIMMIFVAGTNLKYVKNTHVRFYYILGAFMICISMIVELSGESELYFGFLMCIFYSYLINDVKG